MFRERGQDDVDCVSLLRELEVIDLRLECLDRARQHHAIGVRVDANALVERGRVEGKTRLDSLLNGLQAERARERYPTFRRPPLN